MVRAKRAAALSNYGNPASLRSRSTVALDFFPRAGRPFSRSETIARIFDESKRFLGPFGSRFQRLPFASGKDDAKGLAAPLQAKLAGLLQARRPLVDPPKVAHAEVVIQVELQIRHPAHPSPFTVWMSTQCHFNDSQPASRLEAAWVRLNLVVASLEHACDVGRRMTRRTGV
jgi:hypothetical protein